MPYIAETPSSRCGWRLYASALTLASATSFIVVHGTRPFLVTNHHVVTGLNQITGEFMGKHAAHPEMVEISHHKLGQVGQHVMLSEPLYDQAGRGRWLVLQPHLVMFEVLPLVVACAGAGLVASSPVGPAVGVCSGV